MISTVEAYECHSRLRIALESGTLEPSDSLDGPADFLRVPLAESSSTQKRRDGPILRQAGGRLQALAWTFQPLL